VRLSHAKYSVNKQFVKVLMDIHCEWTGTAPSYRVFVNDELFSERTFIWREQYLTEMLQISAEPGVYQVRVEPVLVAPTESIVQNSSHFDITNYQIEHGPAQWIGNGILEIKNES
jgi:hypothetical protein